MLDDTYSDTLIAIGVWVDLAWSDATLASSEAAALKKLIAAAQLSAAEQQVALGWLAEPPRLDGTTLARLPVPQREGIYRAAERLAAVDGIVVIEERRFLAALKSTLALG